MKDDYVKWRKKYNALTPKCIPASAADFAAVNPKGIKTLLANGLITFLLMVILFLATDQVIYQEILLTVSS